MCDSAFTRIQNCIPVCVCLCVLFRPAVLFLFVGDDPLLQSWGASVYPAEVGSPPGVRHHVRNPHPQAIQVL